MREAICPGDRLAITLRYLTTGAAHTTIASSYRVSPTTVGRIIFETCGVLWDQLFEHGYLKAPSNIAEWKKIANDFEQKWNFPNAIGALDGKHIVMFAPAGSGSAFFNYKKSHSIVLLAVCGANYKFTLVDIGDSGRQSDGSVYANSNLGHAIENNSLNFPRDSRVSSRILPYVFLADDAFELKRHPMKPYPFASHESEKRIFNYRMSRGHRIIENAFGIATSRFRVFHKPITATQVKVIATTKAVVVLHNFLMSIKNRTPSYDYCPLEFTDNDSPTRMRLGTWRRENENSQGFQPSGCSISSNNSENAKKTSEEFTEYFNNEGAVEWQWQRVNGAY